MLNLLRLGRVTANTDFEDKAVKIGQAFYENVRQSPSAHTQLMVAIDFAAGPAYEVVIAGGSQADDTKRMLDAIRKLFVPNKIVILRPTDQESPEIDDIAPFTRYHSSIDGIATAYVCLNYNCKLPTTDISSLPKLLSSGQHS